MESEQDTCCCCSLRSACLSIAYLSLFASIASIFLFLVCFDFISVHLAAFGSPAAVHVVFFISLAFLFINIVFNIVLVVGLHEYKRGHISCYLSYATIALLLSVIGFVYMVMARPDILTIFQTALSLALQFCFLIMLSRFYLSMEDALEKKYGIKNTDADLLSIRTI